MKKIYMLALMAMLIPFLASAQLSITGKVIDQATNQPLAGASVSNGSISVQTDVSGKFAINDLQEGRYTLRVSFVGFNSWTTTFNLNRDRDFAISLDRISISAEEVIVRATRASVSTPTTFKNLSKADLEKNNLGQDLPYLLNQTPSVVVSSDAGSGIGYTGIRIRGSDPTRINVTINGIPYNDPESQGTFWVNLPDFASSVDNIQIQRGVGTSTNGAGAFGGSLNIQTTTRNDTAYAELNNSIGSFATRKHTLNFGTGLISGKYTLDGRLSNIASDGYIDRGTSDLKSFFISGAYYGKNNLLRANVFSGDEKTFQVWNGVPEAKLKGDNDALLTHYYNNIDYLYYTTEDSVNLWDSDKRKYSQFTYENQTDNYKQTHYQLLYNQTINPELSLNSALHYTRGRGYFEEFKNKETFEGYGLNPLDYGATAGQETDLIRRRWLDNDFYGVTWSLNYIPVSDFNVTFGGAYNEYDGDHFGDVIAAPQLGLRSIKNKYYDGNGFKKDLNFYLRTEFVAGKTRFYSDFQYRYLDYSITGTDKNLVNHNLNNFHEFFNPKVGVSYQPGKSSSIYASLAVANKEPNRDDYINAIAGEQPKSENLKNVEAGYRFNSSKVRAGLNLYGMFYKDQLVLTGKINDVGEYIRLNAANSSRLGVEFDGRWNINHSLSWAATATLSRNKIKDYTEYMDDYDNGGQAVKTYHDTDISFSPSFIGSNELAYRLMKNAELAILSKYVSKQYLDNTSHDDRSLDAFFVNDLRIRYNTSFKKIKNIGLTLLVNNILNEKYESNGYSYTYLYGQPITENFYFPQAGTNFLLSLSLKL
ncbi:TonB-dependent receptor [Desertivirga xinjiangensis]|uniref:TonB-dependent receptor n=1 Tax=Desertivirga xinjiangensis TaxID=539206 RepID=UPI00210BE2A1|nr:TonB-dependent receptor [Pedobacter xinjiangensis]